MEIDLAKLTPLTPGNWTCKQFADDGPLIRVEMTHADWAFCCQARRAADVLARRGWDLERVPAGWCVKLTLACAWNVRCAAEPKPVRSDPFDAINAAEAWYKAAVEEPTGLVAGEEIKANQWVGIGDDGLVRPFKRD